jgi:hypothetical protein
MRDAHANSQRKARRLFLLCAALCASAALTLLPRAHATTNSINVVNNSSREIIHIYLSHVGQDDWGANQLGNATIAAGQSFTLANVTCDQSQIKVIGEDRDGCFLSAPVACGGDATWTITNDTPADCGGL